MAKRGRPELNFEEKDLIKIRKMAGYGLRDEDIANIFDTAESTLKKYCGNELKEGRSRAFCKVGKTAYQMAISGKIPSMTIFWLKCRGKGQFKEVQYIEESSDDEDNIPKLELKKLSKDELKIYRELLKKASP